ncbi:SlyX family protein [Chitinophaga vietnamensis]|uniref:SlyX family protein n=1 Tax=Chitinophaga vietnamensis TaxID=2593957 RepID=UPI0011783758|nr:SlyX family protein [Chitinophaga vietnamensis]
MKFNIHLALLLVAGLFVFSQHASAQVMSSFKVQGDSSKYYPVAFTDSAWDRNVASVLELGRSNVHTDYNAYGSLIATFRYHTTNGGHLSSFIDADIKQFNNIFVAGWRDVTNYVFSKTILIWLRGSATYYYRSQFNDKVTVYDGVANPLPFQEVNGPAHSYKTAIDNYVTTNGYSNTRSGYTTGNMGYSIANPSARIEIGAAPGWTTSGWGRAIKLWAGRAIEFEAGRKKFGIGASSDSILYFFSTDSDTSSLGVRCHMTISDNGNVGIGTVDPKSYKLAVEGTIGARRVKVTQSAWADFVFHKDYSLPSLQAIENYISKNGHLPDIPSEKEIKEEGLDVGEMNKLLLQKIEELTLHMIRQQKEIDELKQQLRK